MPAWSGLEAANPGLNMAELLAERFLSTLAQRRRGARPAVSGS
jgi:hypothetical protein